MLRDTLKEGGQSNLVFCLRPDYPELVEYRLKPSILAKTTTRLRKLSTPPLILKIPLRKLHISISMW
jgi:hypothetical protein